MLPSAKERKKSMHNFMNYYQNLCEVQNTVPIPGIKINLPNKVLDFFGDKIKLSDWPPILKALACDRYLHYIAIRSRQANKNVLESVDSEEKARKITKSPVLFTDFILTSLILSISKCLSISPSLACLQLEKIPLDIKLINLLMEGLHQTTSLQHLSLKHCRIGDEGCKLVCNKLRYQCKITTLDLSGCELTEDGANFIVDLIKVQKLIHYDESWKQSLRYRIVNPEKMPGLRRITLNSNPHLGDTGLNLILEQLVDDLWIKAIDFQNCGITSFGADHVLELLKENKYLSIIDIRANNKVKAGMITEIMSLLAENNAGDIPEFQWLEEDGQSYKTSTAKTRLCQKNSRTTVYSTSGRFSNISVRQSKSFPNKRSNITIGSSNMSHFAPKRCVGTAASKRCNTFSDTIQPVSKHFSTVLKKNDIEKELERLRLQLAEETTQRKAAEEKLKELQKLHNNNDNYVYIEKTVMEEVAQICENFIAISIANKLPHSRCFYVAVSLSKLMTNSKLDSDTIAQLSNKFKKNIEDTELPTIIDCDKNEKDDMPDTSIILETQDSDTSDSVYLYDDQSSPEEKSSTESTDSSQSQAKFIFQNLLSTRRSQSEIMSHNSSNSSVLQMRRMNLHVSA